MAANKLTEGQREKLLFMLAAGEKQADIAEHFAVTEDNVTYYARKYREQIQALAQERGDLAMTSGLAVRGQRVEKLRALARALEKKLGGADFEFAHGNSLPMVREWRETLSQIRQELKDIEPEKPSTVNHEHTGSIVSEVRVTVVDPKH